MMWLTNFFVLVVDDFLRQSCQKFCTSIFSEILNKIKTILSDMDFIHFHSLSRIILLIWKYPSAEDFLEERVLPFLETLNYLEQKDTRATERFRRCLEIGFEHMSPNHREALQCLLIPCCFLVGISYSRDSSLLETIITRLDRIVTDKRISFKTSPCAAFIKLSSKFLKKLLVICADPGQKLECYNDNLNYVSTSKYISGGGKTFLEFYMTEYLIDCSIHYNAKKATRYYKVHYDDLVKPLHKKLYKHAKNQQNQRGLSA